MISFQHVGSIFSSGGALPSSQVPLQSVMCSSAVRASFPLAPVFDVHVNSTMPRSRYASWRSGSRRRRSSLVACCALRPAVRAQEFAAFTEENLEAFLLNAQFSICEEAAAADGSGKVFVFDKWQRGEDAANGSVKLSYETNFKIPRYFQEHLNKHEFHTCYTEPLRGYNNWSMSSAESGLHTLQFIETALHTDQSSSCIRTESEYCVK